jgi:hypothetical protein
MMALMHCWSHLANAFVPPPILHSALLHAITCFKLLDVGGAVATFKSDVRTQLPPPRDVL